MCMLLPAGEYGKWETQICNKAHKNSNLKKERKDNGIIYNTYQLLFSIKIEDLVSEVQHT